MQKIICDRCGATCNDVSNAYNLAFKRRTDSNFKWFPDISTGSVEVSSGHTDFCSKCLKQIEAFVFKKVKYDI